MTREQFGLDVRLDVELGVGVRVGVRDRARAVAARPSPRLAVGGPGVSMLAAALSTLAAFAPATAWAQPIRVLTLDAARCGACPVGGTTLDILNSTYLATARAAMVNPANFGPGGVILRLIEFLPPVYEFTAPALAGADVVLISSTGPTVPGGPGLTFDERALLGGFVEVRGGLFVLWNNGAAQLAAEFGAVAGGFGDGGCLSTIVTTSPVVGPFGSGAGCVVQNARGSFSNVGPGTAILSNLCGASFTRGAGRAVLINDEEWAWNVGVSPCGIASLNASKLRLFLNSVAHVTPPPCVADVDDGTFTGTRDNGVTIDDLLYYLFIFEVGDLAADVDDGTGTGTPDGGVTIDDLLYYLLRFEAGC